MNSVSELSEGCSRCFSYIKQSSMKFGSSLMTKILIVLKSVVIESARQDLKNKFYAVYGYQASVFSGSNLAKFDLLLVEFYRIDQTRRNSAACTNQLSMLDF